MGTKNADIKSAALYRNKILALQIYDISVYPPNFLCFFAKVFAKKKGGFRVYLL